MKNIFLFIFVFLAKNAFAQSYLEDEEFIVRCASTDTNKAIVIAISGLKIREQPNQQSKVIGIVPYGQKLTRLTKNQNLATPEYTTDSIIGNWERVKYGKLKGYAFNAFYAEGILKIKEKYTLISENKGWCWYDNYGSPFEKINYYAALFSKDSSETILEKFTPTFSYYHGDIGGIPMNCNDKRASSFILVTKENMKEGKIKNALSYDMLLFKRNGFDYQEFHNQLPNSTLFFEIKKEKFIHEETKEEYHGFALYLKDKKTGKSQKIVNEINNTESIKLIWKGDLDNDGKDDFLLDFNGEEYGSFLQLFFTKKAKQIVIPSSKYYLMDCC